MPEEPKPTGDDEEDGNDESAMYNKDRFEGDIGEYFRDFLRFMECFRVRLVCV
jgi:hypothetical protein